MYRRPTIPLAFQNDLRDGLCFGVRDRQCSILHTELCRKLARFTVKMHRRTPSRFSNNLTIAPTYTVVPSRAQCLHGSLFGCETCGIALYAIGLGIAVPHFS